MRLMYARARVARLRSWWSPTLTVPSRPSASSFERFQMPGPLEQLWGYRNPVGELVLVTARGTELPVGAKDWLVMDVMRLLSEIELLPEVAR